MTNGKRVSEGGELGDRFFQVYRMAALRGQPLNSEDKQLAQGYNEQEDVEEEVDRRNIGSAMNLIKVRKNDIFRISPLAENPGGKETTLTDSWRRIFVLLAPGHSRKSPTCFICNH